MTSKYPALEYTIKPLQTCLLSLKQWIWPPQSLISRKPLSGPGLLETKYWKKLRFLTPPLCYQCGNPLPEQIQPQQICAACFSHPPSWDRSRSALIYGEISRQIILSLKWSGKCEGLKLIAQWMAQADPQLLAEKPLLIPVPLHYRRLIKRGFNQSVWIARALHKQTGLPFYPDAIKRRRNTPSQNGKSVAARSRNVAGAFYIQDKSLVSKQHILLIDDVMTTGATLNACAKTLKRAGAKQVDALTLARTHKTRNNTHA